MLLKKAIEESGGFKYMIESLNILSSPGKKHLFNTPFIRDKNELQRVIKENELVFKCVVSENNSNTLLSLYDKFKAIRDIENTIKLADKKIILDDICLFEIKHFAILADSIKNLVDSINLPFVDIPSLLDVIRILDPDNKRIPDFYIYDSYSPELTEIRNNIKNIQNDPKNETLLHELIAQSEAVENIVRKRLSAEIALHANSLGQALNEIVKLDILIAKANQAVTYGLILPVISENNSWKIKGMFHPQISDVLNKKNKEFQTIDINIFQEPAIITGANMTGKSVILKTVALIQLLTQFGFFLPAASAEISPVDTLFLSIGDGQDELSGLSSFAAEMLRINDIIHSTKNKEKILVLIDEPARTTNPKEGKAIVCGVIDFLKKNNTASLITTHYSINIQCRNLRVKGLSENILPETLKNKNLNDLIDYSLKEISQAEPVPHEALRIAEIIGVDKDLLEQIHKHLTEI